MGSKPNTPSYNTNEAINSQNRLNQAVANQTYADVNSPLGSYSVYVDPTTGQMTVNKTLSNASNIALTNQGNLLGKYISDPRLAQSDYYTRQMNYIQPTFDSQIAAAEESLTNRGIQRGSKAWNSAMNNLYEAQDRANTAYENSALLSGQQYQNNLLSQAASVGGQVIDPSMIEGQQGAGLSDLYDALYQNQISKYKTQMANNNAAQRVLGTVGGVAGGVIGGIYGGPGGAAMGAGIGGAAGNAIGASADRA